MNKWESEEEKLMWLRVRLTGKAQTAFMRFPEAIRNDYGESIKALRRRFNPDSKRELYVAELQTRRHKDEDWASFEDALRVLADKAYSDLEDNARERLALNQFLAQITNPQIAFGVKQKRPKTVEEAVVTTIELESYSGSTGERLHVNSIFPQPDSEQAAVGSATAVAAVSPRATDDSRDGEEGLAGILKALNERLHLLERLVENDRRPRQNKDVEQRKKRTRTNITCWKCGEHIARFCRSRDGEQPQGNSNPSVEMASHSRDKQ